MKKFFLFLLAAIAFTACQKEINDSIDSGSNGGGNNGNGNSSNAITGTWNFLSMNLQTQTTQEYALSGIDEKTITPVTLTTINNAGKLIITDSVFTSSGVTYTESASLKGYTYENGALIDSTEGPFSYTVPATNSSAVYKLIGSDSIYFPHGGLVSVAGSSSIQSTPSGGKYSLNGNKLILTQSIYQDTTTVISGISYHTVEAGTDTIFLQKQ